MSWKAYATGGYQTTVKLGYMIASVSQYKSNAEIIMRMMASKHSGLHCFGGFRQYSWKYNYVISNINSTSNGVKGRF